MTGERRRHLVTGGGGFLGGAIVDRLLEAGHEVRSFSRGRYPDLEKKGVETIQGDLGDRAAVHAAAQGCDAVFHVAALAAVAGPREKFERANVQGTHHVIEACRAHGIGKLIYTSSPSVTFAGVDQVGEDESAPYPRKFLADYPRTKADGERLVLESSRGSLATVALRPHLIWGPGDQHLLPRLLDRVRKGRMRFVGSGKKLVDHVYIDNAADAHMLAESRLHPDSAVAGKAYFITNGDPRPLAAFVNGMVEAAGLDPVTRSVPPSLAYGVGAVLEGVWRLLRLTGEPPMTRFVARQLATAHWYDIGAARRDLGYEPSVSFEEGMARLRDWLQDSDGNTG